MSRTKLKQFVSNDPRMIGVLFMMLLLLAESGITAGAAASTVAGP